MSVVSEGRRRRHTFADLYHENTNFQFVARSWRWALISGVLLLVGVVALFTRGLNLSIEFEGGTSWIAPVEGKDPSVAEVRDVLEPLGLAGAKIAVLRPTTTADAPSVRVQAEVLADPVNQIRNALAGATGMTPADVEISREGNGARWSVTAAGEIDEQAVADAIGEVEGVEADTTVEGTTATVEVTEMPENLRDQVTGALAAYAGVDTQAVSINTVGPTWGEQVTRKAAQALVVFVILLALYLTFRFEWKMSAAAVAAMLHDIVVTVGFYALFQFQVTPATVTAFLTILGFSLYDTVVVFDKVGEKTGSLLATGRATYSEMVNRSLNAVLMRSLSTTLVALLPVASLLVVGSFLLGAVALEDFSIALFIGLFIGTYSSLYVAAPLLAWWKEREPRYRALRERYGRGSGTGEIVEPVRVGAGGAGLVDSGVIGPRPRKARTRRPR